MMLTILCCIFLFYLTYFVCGGSYTCMLIGCRDYANMIERRLAGLLMLSYINLLAPEVSMTRAIENVSRHKVPYAIILNEQNETHRSLTLNILHGIPQGNCTSLVIFFIFKCCQ
jgi:uncharacterized MnhB-related membrane protein